MRHRCISQSWQGLLYKMTTSIKLKHIIGYQVTIKVMGLFMSLDYKTQLFHRDESAANKFQVGFFSPTKNR